MGSKGEFFSCAVGACRGPPKAASRRVPASPVAPSSSSAIAHGNGLRGNVGIEYGHQECLLGLAEPNSMKAIRRKIISSLPSSYEVSRNNLRRLIK
jgi:hypothetical protein